MAAPLSPSLQEVTCYVNYGVGAIPLTKWRVVSVHQKSTTLIYIVQFIIVSIFKFTVEFVWLFFLKSSSPISDQVTTREQLINNLNQNFVRFLHLHNTGKQMRALFRLSNKRKDVEALLPPANEVCEGYVFTGVCLSTAGRGGSLPLGSLSGEVSVRRGVSVRETPLDRDPPPRIW